MLSAPRNPIDFKKIASRWTPLTSHDYAGITLALYALDGWEEFDCVEACQIPKVMLLKFEHATEYATEHVTE